MRKSKNRKISAAKVASISLFCMGLLFLMEPMFKNKVIFAINYFDTSKLSDSNLNSPQYIADSSSVPAARQRSHAPEPSTMFLVLSGLGGMIVRYAQKSFIKFKRIMDYVLALVGLTITAPLLILVGVLIKFTSRGPIVYKQERVGEKGKIFKIYKLRTMNVDAEKGTGAVWAKKNDPRITTLGRILRKSHIDEIPQLWNVIRGEMSIVGPRPERPEMVMGLKELIKDYEKRLQIKPGITGLAQIYQRYDETIEDVRKKVKYDLLYIRKMCWLVELRIMAQTFVVALTGKGAR